MEKKNTPIQSKKRKYLNEIVFLRSIACLCIAVVHSLGIAQGKTTFVNSTSDIIVERVFS